MRQRREGHGGRPTSRAIRVAHAALALLLLWTSGPARGSSVLCIGADGHVSIEPDAAACCAPAESEPRAAAISTPAGRSAASGQSVASGIAVEDGPSIAASRAESAHVRAQGRIVPDCRDCIDIPIAVPGCAAGSRVPAGPESHIELWSCHAAAAAIFAVPAAIACVPQAALRRADDAPSPPRGSLSHRWTVVLRR